MADDQNEVRITIREVWAVQQEQSKVLTEMASNLKRFLDSHDRLDVRVTDHEGRIRTLEQKVWAASGAAALMGALIGTVINLVIK